MSSTSDRGYEETTRYEDETRGATLFGASVLLVVGVFQLLEGLSAVSKDDVFVHARNYIFEFDLTTWGWIHIVAGFVAVVVAVAIYMGQHWAFVAGMVIASISAMLQFFFIPWQPFWALVVIAINMAVIWALSARLSVR